jgi:enoyl-CoA hydratase/carnithine racemase
MYECILYEVSEAIATLTLNRPEKLNAYTARMGEELVDAFARARQDDAVRVVILTGAGRGFCAGVDLDELKRQTAEPNAAKGPRIGEEAFVRTWPREQLDSPKPVIAAINGAAIGVGVTMTLPCDIRIAADTAKLGLTFVKLGLLPGLGSTHLLPRIVGLARATELVLTGRTITAGEAREIGLVHRAVPAADLANEARETARAIAAARPEVVTAAKRALRYGASADMTAAMENERSESGRLRG